MDITKKAHFSFIVIWGTGFILGLLTGIWGITLIISTKIDGFHEQIQHLNSIVADREVRLQKLEESINYKRYLVKDVIIHLEFEGDDLEQLILRKTLKDKINILLGKEVKTIDLDLVSAMIDERLIHLKGAEYQTRVNKLVIAEVVQIWITAQRI